MNMVTLEFNDSANATATDDLKNELQNANVVNNAPVLLDESVLSDEERQQVENFVTQIDLNNSGAVMQYGAGAQKKIADFSETVL